MKRIITALLASITVVALATTSSATPQPSQTNYWTSVCCTGWGNCQTTQVVQNGTPCWCATPGGPVYGNAC